MEGHRVAPGFQASSGQVPVRSLGAPMPPVDFALAAGASGPTGALAGVNTKELQGELQKAIDMANSGQHDAAITAYEAILAKTPALTMINGQIAQVKRLKKDYDGAIASYQKVLAADPNNDKAKIEIGMTYLEKGDFANAEKSLLEVATSVNASREVFYNLGEVKFAKGETDEAVKYYERAAQMDAAWGKPLFKLGLAKLQKADTAGAIEYMNKVIAAEPNSAEAAQAKALIEQLKKGIGSGGAVTHRFRLFSSFSNELIDVRVRRLDRSGLLPHLHRLGELPFPRQQHALHHPRKRVIRLDGGRLVQGVARDDGVAALGFEPALGGVIRRHVGERVEADDVFVLRLAQRLAGRPGQFDDAESSRAPPRP